MLGSGAGRDQGTLRMSYQLTLTPAATPTDNAVPEPATVIMFALVAPLILWRRRHSLRIS